MTKARETIKLVASAALLGVIVKRKGNLVGSLGGFLGMIVFHHKTRKWKFRIFVPVFLILQVICLYLLWR